VSAALCTTTGYTLHISLVCVPRCPSCRFEAFPGSDYQAYIHTSKYARWLHGPKRRESWKETVTRRAQPLAALPSSTISTSARCLHRVARVAPQSAPRLVACTEWDGLLHSQHLGSLLAQSGTLTPLNELPVKLSRRCEPLVATQ
jgi:hypothetical protein